MKAWKKPEIWELSAKYTACGVPIIVSCSGGSGGGNSSGGGSSGGGSKGGGKGGGKKGKNNKKGFNWFAWFFGGRWW